MPDITHRQYDELPVHDFTLGFDGVTQASWPALNATDKVTLICNRTGTATTVTLTKVDLVARLVRWSPSGALVAAAGTFPFAIRVTQTDGNSYTHPASGTWNLKVDAAVVTTDVVDP